MITKQDFFSYEETNSKVYEEDLPILNRHMREENLECIYLEADLEAA